MIHLCPETGVHGAIKSRRKQSYKLSATASNAKSLSETANGQKAMPFASASKAKLAHAEDQRMRLDPFFSKTRQGKWTQLIDAELRCSLLSFVLCGAQG